MQGKKNLKKKMTKLVGMVTKNIFANLFQAIDCRVYDSDIDTRIVVSACHRATAATSSSRSPSLSILVAVWLFAESAQLPDVMIGTGQAPIGGGLAATTHTTEHNTPAVPLFPPKATVKLVDL